MANITAITANFVEITGLDANWASGSASPNGIGVTEIYVSFIQFRPSAIGDHLIIRNGVGGAVIVEFTAGAVISMGRPISTSYKINPSITIAECTINTPANAMVLIELSL